MQTELANDSAQLKIRTNQNLRSALEKAAIDNKVSMNSEIISRLEQSFLQKPAEEYVESSEVSGLCMLLARLMQEAGSTAGFQSSWTIEGSQHWHKNAYAFDQVIKAVTTVLEALRPEGAVEMPRGPLTELYKVVGQGLAATWLSELASGEAISEGHSDVLPVIEKKLGTMVDRVRGRDFGVHDQIKLPE